VHTVAKMLVIANGDRYGTGAIINPEGKIDDGVFEIIALNPEGLSEMVALSVDFFRGTIHQSPFVKNLESKKSRNFQS